ncbi:hypothetical protein LTR78_009530 [Recurvomyces mirabilis]|uniref:F-box domain-containing protein n=1 Tax=Recurvomyces mirabilis TaxID=574656 RepID=A0AAE0TNK9_9PEZI|nr:hypothetical protein LTR78_009530 [Recurvomyces mirabilis]KAK5150015.1 hypothetical protein LTS14_010487 [Recurvomyces mirabilis]
MDSPTASEPLSPEEDFYGDDAPDASDAPVMDTTARLEVRTTPEQEPVSSASVHLDLVGASAHDKTREDHSLTNGAATSEHSTDSHTEDHSSSDMDMSESEQEAELDASTPSLAQQELACDQSQPAVNKRKLSDTLDESEVAGNLPGNISSKRLRLSTSGSCFTDKLTPELLQQVFTRLSPAMLCRCRRVCKRFEHVLTSYQNLSPTPKKDTRKVQPVRLIDSNAIFRESRQKFMPNMPRPLEGHTELGMLKLMSGRTCQGCDRAFLPQATSFPFNAGPGRLGLRVIWPFGQRWCGTCFEARTVKDIEVLTSPGGPFRAGLSYAFQTMDMNFVGDTQRQTPVGIPSTLRASKVYSKTDVQHILAEAEETKAYGAGVADEWQKGLATKGKQSMTDCARWERWEASFSQGRDLSQVLRESDPQVPSLPVKNDNSKSAGVSSAESLATFHGPLPLPLPVHTLRPPGFAPPMLPANAMIPPPTKPVRTQQDIELARAARRADIERRCQELQPPLPQNILHQMPCFKESMQISIPMDDAQWKVLEPRLLAQREAAELIEHKRTMDLAALQTRTYDVPTENLGYFKPAKEVYGTDYDRAQEPLRKRLAEYADEITGTDLQNQPVTSGEEASELVIKVLTHAKTRYDEDKASANLPNPVSLTHRRISMSIEDRPYREPFLSLDNMKSLYENKVRGRLGHQYSEPFMCADCPNDWQSKLLGFESLIQHFGAKHTSSFGTENVVVHWQLSEWPVVPPFHPQPCKKPGEQRRKHKGHQAAHKALGRTWTPSGHNDTISFKNAAAHHGGQFTPGSNPGHHGLSVNTDGVSDHPSIVPNGYVHGAPAHAGQQHRLGDPQRSFSNSTGASAAFFAGSYGEDQMSQFMSDARATWDALAGIKEMLDCVRIQTTIYTAAANYAKLFVYWPGLDMVTDALATSSKLQPLKEASGLACQLCTRLQHEGLAKVEGYYARIKDVQLRNFTSLATHFKLVHVQDDRADGPQWHRDMIEWPESAAIAKLMHSQGMDDIKLSLLAKAFPAAFPPQLPQIGHVTESAANSEQDSALIKRLTGRWKPKQPKSKKKNKNQNANGTPQRSASLDSTPAPTADQYDPRNPMDAEEDPMARFDSDVARKKGPSPVVSTPSAGTTIAPGVNLSAETLAMLSNLTSHMTQPQQQQDQSTAVKVEPIDTNDHAASNGILSAELDFTSVLASLTQHLPRAQSGTPLSAGTQRFGNATRSTLPHPSAVFQESPSTYRPQDRRAASEHYAAERTYQAPPSPHRYEPRDIQATMARNTSHYQQNQQGTYSHPAEATSYPTSTHRSPPRYRYLDAPEQPLPRYEDPPLPAHSHPAYRGAAPLLQYMHAPEHLAYEPAGPPQHAQGYGYHPAPSHPPPPPPHTRTVYVDQFGHPLELIPIDNAPAPIQYAPHPYEQQMQMGYGQQTQPQYQVYYEPALEQGRSR